MLHLLAAHGRSDIRADYNEVSEALGDVVFVTSQLGAQLNCEKGALRGFVVFSGTVNEGSP